MLKRTCDICISAVALVLLAPIILVIAALVRWHLGSPVLFCQLRPGLNGQLFKLMKFRSMRHPTQEELKLGLASDGARLTKFGSFLRSTSMDELPSLWNVLKGNMSLVGPRPLLQEYLDRYTQEQARRHEVRPGITGYAQVNGRNALDWEQKFKLDVWYVDNQSLWLDIKILAKTAGKVIRRDGISAENEATMTEFLGSKSVTD